jgi:hypothetical protein
MPSTASLTWRPRISATLYAIIPPAPVAVLPPPARGRLDRAAVLSEPGSTRARHELAIGATAKTCLVGLRQRLVSHVSASARRPALETTDLTPPPVPSLEIRAALRCRFSVTQL